MENKITVRQYISALDTVRKYLKQTSDELPKCGLSRENIQNKSFDLLTDVEFDEYITPILNTRIKDSSLSQTVINYLNKIDSFVEYPSRKRITGYRIVTVKDLLGIPKQSLKHQRGIGAAAIKEIDDYLNKYGLILKN